MVIEYAVTYLVSGTQCAYLLKSNIVAIISSKLLLSERKASPATESVLQAFIIGILKCPSCLSGGLCVQLRSSFGGFCSVRIAIEQS